VIAGSISQTMERWERFAQTRERVDLHDELAIVTMRTFLRTMLSSSISEDEIPRMIKLLSLQSRYVIGLIMTFWAPGWVPSPGQRRGAPATGEIRSIIDRVIAERRANPVDNPDVLNRLLEIRHEDTGEPLSDAQLCDELNGFLIAGFDTTSAALTWSLALLATNPEAAEQLRAEADAYTGDFSSGAEADSMPYARAVFSEAQRLQGFIGVFFRAIEDDEIGGYHIPAGSQVGWSDYLLGRNPRIWDHPDRFDPNRFLGERLRCQHRYQALPFGGGRHLCIGFRLSVLQAQFALTMIAKRFHVQPEPGFQLRHRAGVSIELIGGLPATLRPRP
jgi:cytochrome P450